MNNEEKNKQTQKSAIGDADALDTMEKTGAVVMGRVQCLSIIGQIEGHYLASDGTKTTKYEHILPLLCAVEESREIGGLLILLNTVGGDVEAGLAMAEMIAGMKKPSVSLVLGGGHSIGVPLAVASGYSFIVPSATMTIHPVRTSGLVLGVPQSFEALRRMQDRISTFVTDHSRISPEKLRELMMCTDEMATDCGTIIDGREAVDVGLIDEIGGLSAAMDKLHAMMETRDLPDEKADLNHAFPAL